MVYNLVLLFTNFSVLLNVVVSASPKSRKCRKTEVFGALPIFKLRNNSHIYTLLRDFFEFGHIGTQKWHYLAVKWPFTAHFHVFS